MKFSKALESTRETTLEGQSASEMAFLHHKVLYRNPA
jgi:hypothetical protein